MVAENADRPPDEREAVAGQIGDGSAHSERNSTKPNPYVAFACAFADDSFADEVDAYIAAERQRQRQVAAARARE